MCVAKPKTAAAPTAALTTALKKLKTISAANFYHSNTPIFIRRNIIYVFTFHNPLRSLLFVAGIFRYTCRTAANIQIWTRFSHFSVYLFFVCEEISAHKSSICSWYIVHWQCGVFVLRYGISCPTTTYLPFRFWISRFEVCPENLQKNWSLLVMLYNHVYKFRMLHALDQTKPTKFSPKDDK